MRRNAWYIGPAFVALALLSLGGAATPVSAAVCAVPQQYSAIQIAVNNSSCTTINVAPGTYYETVTIRRSLTLQGAGGQIATIAAQVHVLDPNVLVNINNIHINTTGPARHCFLDGLKADGGAQVDVVNVQVDNDGGEGTCSFFQLLFADDFETGNTSRWSSTLGRSSGRGGEKGAAASDPPTASSTAATAGPRREGAEPTLKAPAAAPTTDSATSAIDSSTEPPAGTDDQNVGGTVSVRSVPRP